ncbi:uncharacterized protein [Miscanthus floridulus]|uniref:uncharacterized protein n=1 Tax=Miscanthus floridulus TaxID=154761 RepID=UPI003458A6C3
MDGGSGFNIMYAKTLDEMGVDRMNLRPIQAPFHGIVPGRQAIPLGQIDLPITFEDRSNYRTETLTFDVVGFPGTFHAILGRQCYAKFMAIPNYTYLKLKMPSPHRVITISTSFHRAYECKVECCSHATAVVASEELATLWEEVIEEAPDVKRSFGSFELAKGPKEVLLDPSNSEGKKSASGPRSPLNRKAHSSTSSTITKTSLRGNPRICQASRGRLPSIP